MKKLLLLLTILFGASITNAQTNLVANGDFEEWSWGNVKDWGRFMRADVERSSESQNGDYSALLTLDDFGNYLSFIYAENITFEKGKTYDISLYYKMKTGSLSQFQVIAYYTPTGAIWAEELFSKDIQLPTLGADWTKFSMSHTEATGTKLDKFQILVRSTADASILIDNVVITEQGGGASLDENGAENINVYFDEAGNIAVDGVANIESVNIYSVDGKFAANKSGALSLASGTYVVVVKGDGIIVSKKAIKQ